MNYNRVILTLLIGAIIGLPAVGYGKDTDVYLKAKGAARDDSPNILIILDNSGSMNTAISSATRLPYNSTITYSTQSGSPGFDNNKVYWSSSGSPPSSGTNQWVSVANNKCLTSVSFLTGSTGMYSGDKVVGWQRGSGSSYPPSSGTTGAWAILKNSTGGWGDTVLDCQSDNPADATGTYLAKGTTAYSARYTSTSGQAISWSSFGSVTLYSGNYMNYIKNTDTSNTTVWDPAVTRISAARDAVKAIIGSTQNVRFGLMVFNTNNSTPDGGRVIAPIDNMDAARITKMNNLVDSITAYTYTPLSETMWEAYQYLAGKPVLYGNPTSEAPAQDFCAQVQATPAPAVCVKGTTYKTPFKYSCQKAFIIYVTDGDPSNDTAANSKIAALPGIGTLSGDGYYLDELAKWMSKNDVVASITGTQTVTTYTVGFGGSISTSGLQLLSDTATKSGGRYFNAVDAAQLTAALTDTIFDILQTTTSYTAPALSVNAFNSLYNRDEVYFAMFKPSSRILWDGNVKKYKLCSNTNGTSTPCTFGEIIDKNNVAAVDPVTQRIKDGALAATSFWSSVADGNVVNKGGTGEKIPAPISRKVYTYTGGYDATNGRTPSGGSAILSSSGNLVADGNASLTAGMLSVSTTTERTDLINWILGVDVRDVNSDTNVTQARSQANNLTDNDGMWALYDPVHSRPVAITYGGTTTSPVIKLFTGTNDGMVHMFNENTGIEEWAFMPKELLAQQNALSYNTDGEHPWGVDGTPTFQVYDANNDGIINPVNGDFVHMFIGMRRGGNNIYAFDVTPSAAQTVPSSTGNIQPTLLWVIRGGITPGYERLGQTWSSPTVTTIRYGTGVGSGTTARSTIKTVLAFAGGYNVDQDDTIPVPSSGSGNAIYLVDPDTGARLWWASASNGCTTGVNCPDLILSKMIYGIPSDLTLLDANGDGATDRIYVGDLGGQLWRIDLAPELKLGTATNSNGYVLADIACPSGTRPACTGTALQDRRKFFYPPDVAQVVDITYQDLANSKHDLITISSGDREDPLDILTYNQVPTAEAVHNRVYVFRDYQINPLSTGGTITYPSTPLKEVDLYNSTNDLFTNTATDVTAMKAKKGWFVSMNGNTTPWLGEKGLARTSIFAGKLYVTTYTPANGTTSTVTCKADEGLGKLYGLNLLNGAPAVDFNGDGTIDTDDIALNVGGGIPSHLVTIIRPGGVSGLVGTVNPSLNSSLPRGKNNWFQ